MCEPPVRALLAVADPTDWPPTQPEPVDLPGAVERARAALGDIPTTVLPAPCSGARATLASIRAALRDAPPICYLVGHALLVQGTPCLWMEQPDGSGAPVAAMTLAAQLTHADDRPSLVVLAAYAEAGSPDDAGALAAVGLGLAQAGLPAVLTVPGCGPAATMDRFLAIFFRAFRREGRVDRALAVARDAVPAPGDQPVCFLRDADGQIAQGPPHSVERGPLADDAGPGAPCAARSVPADMV